MDKSYLCSVKHIYKYIVALSLLLTSAAVQAQTNSSSGLRFLSDTFDYGDIAEDGGAIMCRFEAVNSAMAGVEVLNIVTTCGCTSARYERRVVAPNEKFVFEVSYDPMNRPGRLEKHIFVHVSDCPDPIKLTIVGYVQPRERTIAELYPFDMGGGLRLVSNFHAFGYFEAGKGVEERIRYVNNSMRPITVELRSDKPSGFITYDNTVSVAPGAMGDIVFRCDNPRDAGVYGSVQEKIRVRVDGVDANYTIDLYAIAVDNFDLVDDISAPKLVISKNIIKFGEVNDHSVVMEQSLTLKNGGASPLFVRALESESAAVEVVGDKTKSIAPGGEVSITLRLRGEHIDDWDNPLVTRIKIITNDPMRPMQVVRVNALPQ